MCLAKPTVAAATTSPSAPAQQAASQPGATPIQRRRALGGLASTLLTAPSGISTASAATGANTLLGA